jgi:hypothetical protein
MYGKVFFAALAAAAGAAVLTAAPATADVNDDMFITVLDNEAIPYSTAESAIALAHAVCDYVAAGQTPDQVAIEISGPADWSLDQSTFVVHAATLTYCPA